MADAADGGAQALKRPCMAVARALQGNVTKVTIRWPLKP